MKNKLK